MASLDWDKEVWNVIDSYFKYTDNYLTKNQLDSFNQFISNNIPKTLRQFNPITVQFGDTLDVSQIPEKDLNNQLTKFGLSIDGNNIEKRVRLQEETDKNIEKYRHEIHIYVGATYNKEGEKIVSINNERFISRRHALWNGFVTISIVLNVQGLLVCPPQVSQTGVSDNKDMDQFLTDCSFLIEDFLEKTKIKTEYNDEELTNKIIKLIRKEFKSIFSKRPSFSVHINRV